MEKFEKIIKLALKEDIASGDITTNVFVPKNKKFKGIMTAKDKGVLCGINISKRVFKIIDSKAKFEIYANDGDIIRKGQKLMSVEGSRGMLIAERTALNFIQRLSGIATYTNKFAEKLKGRKTFIFDTRKTTPGLRVFEKYAVACGGGKNHRMGLYDAFLIKDNHLAALGANVYPALEEKISLIRKKYKGVKIEIEAKTLAQVEKFALLGADIIMLDNMNLKQMKKAIKIIREAKGKKTPEIEISGNVALKKLPLLSKLSPERISAGAITHSAAAMDISFNIEEVKNEN